MSNKKANKILNIITLTLLSLLVLTIVFCLLIATGPTLLSVFDWLTWRQSTNPLTEEVADDLCEKFDIPSDDPRCDHQGKTVYGPDFFPELYDTFTPIDGPWATYDEVENLVGIYEYRQEGISISSDGREYIVHHYDFAGDKVHSFAIAFYLDGQIKRLVATVTD